jgi:hypothetical protein
LGSDWVLPVCVPVPAVWLLFLRVVGSPLEFFLALPVLLGRAAMTRFGLRELDELLELPRQAVASALVLSIIFPIILAIHILVPRSRSLIAHFPRPRPTGVIQPRLLPSFLRTRVATLHDLLEEVVLGDEVGLVEGCLPHLSLVLKILTRQEAKPKHAFEAHLVVGLNLPPCQSFVVVCRHPRVKSWKIFKHG